jgi:methylated-DNA-[protein]-cysteine S-methyltransferase
MTEEGLKYTTFNTDVGWVGILGSARGVLGLTLPQPSAQEARKLLGESVNDAIRSPRSFEGLAERLKFYFGGTRVDFPDEIDLSRATHFQRGVWEKTRLIPYGEARSYLWVAEQVGNPKAARAVGQALAKNPLLIIIPCHRVIASDGSIGGFGGGLGMKRFLLSLETRGK